MKRSCVQVYTGDGKGKTTAAIGLAVRAAGCGLCVKIVQFMKGRESGEVTALNRIGGIELRRVAVSGRFFCDMTDAEKALLRGQVRDMLPVIDGWLDEADVLILDEALGAVTCGVLEQDELLRIIERRGGTEVVLTGRNVPEPIRERAHLVTEMRAVKHYIDEGICARKGIEY